ncbi:MAG: hypothetical protein R3B83_08975 [Nitrospirales bacterium]|nr:hypothetical protein [Nitrospirales bacterium]
MQKILGDLLSIYDGSYAAKATGTVGILSYDSSFKDPGLHHSRLLKSTRAMSSIGGRFLCFEVESLSDEQKQEGI